MAKFERWVNNPYKRKIGPSSMDKEYEAYRKEVMRMINIANKRIKRSSEQGFDNLLITADRRKPMSTKEFNALDKEAKRQMLNKIKNRTEEMWNLMDMSTSSIGGFKKMIKDAYENKKIGTIPIDFASGMSEKDAFKAIQSQIESNLSGMTAHYRITELLDEIDRDTTLDDDTKKLVKDYIRHLLDGDIFDYEQAYYFTVDEIKRMLPDIIEKMKNVSAQMDTSGEIDTSVLDII